MNYFQCGNIYKDRNYTVYLVVNFSDILNKIIPFFNQHKILGSKFYDFLDWCLVANIIKQSEHFTDSGIKRIMVIHKGMNSRRSS